MVKVVQEGYSLFLNGKEYFTQEEIYADFKINAPMLKYRLDNGLTVEEALGVEDYKNGGKYITVEHKGLVYRSLSELCTVLGYKYSRVYGWLKKGYSLEDALSKSKDKVKGAVSVNVEGVEYPSIAEACKHYGLSPQKVIGRLKYNWTVHEAFEVEKRVRPKRRATISKEIAKEKAVLEVDRVEMYYEMVKSNKTDFIDNLTSRKG